MPQQAQGFNLYWPDVFTGTSTHVNSNTCKQKHIVSNNSYLWRNLHPLHGEIMEGSGAMGDILGWKGVVGGSGLGKEGAGIA